MILNELLKALAVLDCSVVADADKSIAVCDAGLARVNPGRPLVGVARCVYAHEDFLPVIQALGEAKPGDVLVVDTQASTRALVGELFSLEAQNRGLAGIVVDGLMRDVRTLRGLDLPIYARGFCPCSGTTQTLAIERREIVCGGVTARTGDVVFGDDDGLMIGSPAQFESALPKAQAIADAERVAIAEMAAGKSLFSLLNAQTHIDALERGEQSALAFIDGQ